MIHEHIKVGSYMGTLIPYNFSVNSTFLLFARKKVLCVQTYICVRIFVSVCVSRNKQTNKQILLIKRL